MKLGLRPIDIEYYFPSTIPGAPPLAGELLWVPFVESTAKISQEQLCSILERVYISGYGLRADDPFIASMLSQFKTANL